MFNSRISGTEIKKVICELKAGKAVSIDLIPNEILKNDTSVECLNEMFNYFLNEAVVPETWKKAQISPIYKGKSKDISDPKSY